MIASVECSVVSGELYAPPSKSYTHRAILITSLGPGGRVLRPLLSADTLATISASEAFGARISKEEKKDDLHIEGVRDQPQTPEDVIDVLNSGTTLRFCSAVAAL
ncbi:MAG: 3-phosphoshikimate 1-carboxyvinyltransferase, partial [Methanothrix sp.]